MKNRWFLLSVHLEMVDSDSWPLNRRDSQILWAFLVQYKENAGID